MLTTPRLILAAALVGGVLALPAIADAQSRGGGHAGGHGGAVAAPHGGVAVPRGPVAGPVHGAAPYRYPYYGYGYGYRYPYYYPYYPYYHGGVSVGLGLYYGYPWGWGSIGFGLGYPYYGYPYYGYYPYYPAPAYEGYSVAAAPPSGGIRIDVPQRDAEVVVDGNFAGTVEDFNGRTQALPLSPGSHHIEIRAKGFETASFDVNVDPGRTITYRSSLRPAQP